MRHWIEILLVSLSLAVLQGCAPVYQGPLADKPLQLENPHTQKIEVETLFNHVIQEDVPALALEQAFSYFDQNRSRIRNQDWLTIADFTLHSGEPRLYVINLESGAVDHLVVAHGIGSDPDRTGFARTFSNDFNSLMTSLGFYLVSESYTGRWGLSARLDGLQDSNSNARERAVVMHGATYVDSSRPIMGWTEGCLGVELKWIETLVSRLRGGSLLYNYIEGL